MVKGEPLAAFKEGDIAEAEGLVLSEPLLAVTFQSCLSRISRETVAMHAKLTSLQDCMGYRQRHTMALS